MEQVIEGKALKEISKFSFNEKDYILIEPSAAVVREANKRRNRKFVEYLKEGMYTKSRMQKQILEENPDFFVEFNTAREEVVRNIDETETVVKDLDDPDQLEALSQILVIYRAELVEQEQLLRGIFESTADAMADEERNSYLVYAMLRDSDNNRVAESFEEFLENVSYEFFDLCKYKLLCWEHKLDADWEKSLPEAKAIIRANRLREEAEKREAEKKAAESEKVGKTVKSETEKKSPAKRTRKTAAKKSSTKSTAKKTATRKTSTRKRKVATKEE